LRGSARWRCGEQESKRPESRLTVECAPACQRLCPLLPNQFKTDSPPNFRAQLRRDIVELLLGLREPVAVTLRAGRQRPVFAHKHAQRGLAHPRGIAQKNAQCCGTRHHARGIIKPLGRVTASAPAAQLSAPRFAVATWPLAHASGTSQRASTRVPGHPVDSRLCSGVEQSLVQIEQCFCKRSCLVQRSDELGAFGLVHVHSQPCASNVVRVSAIAADNSACSCARHSRR